MLLSCLWKNQWVLEIYSWAISADIIHIYVFLKEAIWFHSFIFFHKAKLFVFFFLNYVRLTILIIFCLRITQTKTRISEFSHHVLKLFFVFGKKIILTLFLHLLYVSLCRSAEKLRFRPRHVSFSCSWNWRSCKNLSFTTRKARRSIGKKYFLWQTLYLHCFGKMAFRTRYYVYWNY